MSKLTKGANRYVDGLTDGPILLIEKLRFKKSKLPIVLGLAKWLYNGLNRKLYRLKTPKSSSKPTNYNNFLKIVELMVPLF